MSTVSWHDRWSRSRCHSDKNCPVALPQLNVLTGGQRNCDNPVLFVTLCVFFDPMYPALRTFTSPGKLSNHFCLSFFLLAVRVTCRGHLHQTVTAGFTAATLFLLSAVFLESHTELHQVFIIKKSPLFHMPLGNFTEKSSAVWVINILCWWAKTINYDTATD